MSNQLVPNVFKDFSTSVSNALQLVCEEKASETAHFFGLVDKFFGTMNVHNYTKGAKSLKRFPMPFKSSDDFRLQVILLCALQLCNIYF